MSITTRENRVYQSDSGMLAGEIHVSDMTGAVFYRHSSPNGLSIGEMEEIIVLMRAKEIQGRAQ